MVIKFFDLTMVVSSISLRTLIRPWVSVPSDQVGYIGSVQTVAFWKWTIMMMCFLKYAYVHNTVPPFNKEECIKKE